MREYFKNVRFEPSLEFPTPDRLMNERKFPVNERGHIIISLLPPPPFQSYFELLLVGAFG